MLYVISGMAIVMGQYSNGLLVFVLPEILEPLRGQLSVLRCVLNLFGSHSPPLAASRARVSEPDVLLTAAQEQLTLSSRNTPPLGAGILYWRRIWGKY